MANQSIPTATSVPIEVTPLLDKATLALKTGVTVKMKVRRKSDAFAFDWSDLTFKTLGSVVTLESPDFVEIDATDFPGEYALVFDLAIYSGLNVQDVYEFTVIESGSSDVSNLPQAGEVRTGDAPALDVDAIADQVWRELVGDHSGEAGSTAEALIAAAGTISPAAIAAAVWDALTSAHGGTGTFGRAANALAEETTVAATPTPTATDFGTGLTQADQFWTNIQVVIVDAGGTGEAVVRNVNGYVQTDGVVSVDALPFVPTVGDPVIILRRQGKVTEIVASNLPDL